MLIGEITNYDKNDAKKYERQKKIKKAKTDFFEFAKAVNPAFFSDEKKYQKLLCDFLQKAYEKKHINPDTKKPYDIFIINLPPGFGKSYTASLFTIWCYGQNKKNIAITVSYNQTLSTRFAKTVRDLIDDKQAENADELAVSSIFPKLKIKKGDGAMNLWALEGEYMSYLASSFEGSITGMRANIGIIDDPIKNKAESYNDAVKEAHFDFYKNTFASRMLPKAIQIIILTRWATDDLAGRLLSEFNERCLCFTLAALDENDKSICESLYPTEDLLQKRRTIDEDIWLSNYMQKPIDKKGILYQEFQVYDELPEFENICAYTDTADEGVDFLCAFIFGICEDKAYILDIYYTDKAMEYTEPELARRLDKYKVRFCVVESNNGGRGFARNVKRILKDELKNKACIVTWFCQRQNKKARILSHASNVISDILFPKGWEKRYSECYAALKSFKAKGKNINDDAPDALTGVSEMLLDEVKYKSRLSVLKRR